MKTLDILPLACLFCFASHAVCGQSGVKISVTPVPDEPGAVLHVQSSEQGVLLPRTRAESILSPVHGLLVFDTTENTFMFYDSNHWVALLKASDFSFFYADRDGDSWGDPFAAIFAPFAPPGYVSGIDCDDTDENTAPGMPELCDNIDNDCDPETADGADVPEIGTPCDGPDLDPCPEGVITCIDGVLVCTDMTGDSFEICGDNIDNDCDGIIDSDCITIHWANLQHPPSIEMLPGTTPAIYGQVWSAGITDGVGQGAGIFAQVGYGTDGSDPALGGWTWVNASYNTDVANNDEYEGTLTVNETGSYDYAYRFSGDGGYSWTYADLDGIMDGYDPADAGAMTVGVSIDYAILQHPPVIMMSPGTTEFIYGRVFSSGITEAVGVGAGISAEVGYGPDGSDPTLGGWTWVVAAYNLDAGNDDEYQGVLNVVVPGMYDYAYRFSGDGGATWTYADLDGTIDGYDPADAGGLTVNP